MEDILSGNVNGVSVPSRKYQTNHHGAKAKPHASGLSVAGRLVNMAMNMWNPLCVRESSIRFSWHISVWFRSAMQ
jgi:hypothetical protein